MSKELIRAVVQAREEETQLNEVKQDALQAWGDANRELLEFCQEAKTKREKAEEALREAGLKEYEVTKDKHPIPGTEIKVSVKLVYEPETALAWAIEHKQAVRPASLNAKEFEAIVKAMAEKPDFVTMKEEAKATLASDMAAVLEGVGE